VDIVTSSKLKVQSMSFDFQKLGLMIHWCRKSNPPIKQPKGSFHPTYRDDNLFMSLPVLLVLSANRLGAPERLIRHV
jgi:hypothetical protein